MNMKNKKGIIKIRKQLFDDELQNGGLVLKEIFSVFFPTNIEYSHFEDCFIYYGYSPEFIKVEEGSVYPTYDVIVTRSDNGVYTISFKEI